MCLTSVKIFFSFFFFFFFLVRVLRDQARAETTSSKSFDTAADAC